MIKLVAKENSPISKQEVGTLEFFLNTPKKVASVVGVYAEQYKDYIKDYPLYVVNPEKGKFSSVVIAKDEESLEQFKRAKELTGSERFRQYGKLFGYPPTAIDYFVDAKKDRTSKFKVTYYGLGFVCERDEAGLAKVEKELVEMYGFPLDPKYYSVTVF